jgi:4'-phosphopantetheinyl transferase
MQTEETIYWTLQDQATLPDLAWLSAAESSFYQTLRFPKRREEWLAGRWTAKNLLVKTMQPLFKGAMNEISIEKAADGSPKVVCGATALPGCLSISHRANTIAAAYAPNPNIKIGIDLEVIEPKASSFVEDFFTTKERAAVLSRDPAGQALASSLIWSAKEAVLKAARSGLSIDTRRVEIEILPDQNISGWQCLGVSFFSADQELTRLFWQQKGEILITLAAISPTQLCETVRPEAIIQIEGF